jgi:hypothetical protein
MKDLWDTDLFSNACETTRLAALMHRVCDPVNPGVTANLRRTVKLRSTKQVFATYGLMIGINKYDFIILVNAILIHPVGVQHSQVTASSTHAFLSSTPETTLVLEVVNTLSHGFAVGST